MQGVLETATNVSSPLMIGGFLAGAFFLILRQILKLNVFPTLTKDLSSEIIVLIINRLFYLALVAIVLGFVGFVLVSNPGIADADGAKKRVIAIDSFVRRYDKSVQVTNAETIVDFVQSSQMGSMFETEHMLVGPNFRNHDDIARKNPALVIIHLSAFFGSTNATVDHDEFELAIEELTAVITYIRDTLPNTEILVYTRETPESGVWPLETHQFVIQKVEEVESLIESDSSMHLLEVPWEATFTQPAVMVMTKSKLQEILSGL